MPPVSASRLLFGQSVLKVDSTSHSLHVGRYPGFLIEYRAGDNFLAFTLFMPSPYFWKRHVKLLEQISLSQTHTHRGICRPLSTPLHRVRTTCRRIIREQVRQMLHRLLSCWIRSITLTHHFYFSFSLFVRLFALRLFMTNSTDFRIPQCWC